MHYVHLSVEPPSPLKKESKAIESAVASAANVGVIVHTSNSLWGVLVLCDVPKHEKASPRMRG